MSLTGRPSVSVAPVTTATVATMSIGFMPVALVGAWAVSIQDELGFGAQGLGFASSTFFLFAALAAAFGGGHVERWGPRRALQVSMCASAVCLFGTASFVSSWASFLVLIAIGGAANGAAQLGGNVVLVSQVPMVRQGAAFGIKQAASTLGTAAAALSVPVLGLGFGWRGAFTAFGAIAIVLLVLVIPATVRARVSSRPSPLVPRERGPLMLLGVGAGIAAGGGVTLTTFLVVSYVASGGAEATGAWLLAVGGAFGAFVRIVLGWVADRVRWSGTAMSAWLIGIGSLGYGSLWLGTSLPYYVVGSFVVFAIGWSWPGLVLMSVVKAHRGAPGRATGIVQGGVFTGGVVAPIVFGGTASTFGFQRAWLLMACSTIVAGLLVAAGDRRLVGARRPGATDP